MAKTGRNKPRGGSNLTKEQAQKIALNIASTALFVLPGGQVVRAAVTAGKVAPKALQMIRSLGGKKIAKPTQAQITKSTTLSALPKAKTPAATAGARAKSQSTAVTVGSKAKGKTPTGTAVAKRPSTAVGPKKPSGQTREMKNITPIKRTKITTKPPKKSTKPMSKGKAAAIVGTTAALTGAALLGSKGPKKSAASVTAPTSRPKRPTKRTGMSEGNTVAGSSGRDPRTRNAPNVGLGKMPKKAAKKVPSTKSRDKDGEGTGKINLPAGAKRKFQGSYNSKKEKLRNIGGKTYVFNK